MLIRLLSTTLVLVSVAGETLAQRAAPRVIALAAPNATLTTEFTRVGTVRELADGRTLIGDVMDRKLFVGDWSKGTATQIGRVGSGPGEYAQVEALFPLRGDSTLMPDTRNGRWLLLHGAAFVGTIGSDAPPLLNGARSPIGADQRGTVIATRPVSTGAISLTAGPRHDSLLLVRIARADGRCDTVAVIRARPATISVQGPADKPTSVSISMNPLATGEVATLFPDGWIAIARLDPYRVEWIAPDGNHVRGPALPFEAVRLDDREIRAYLQRQAARNGTELRDPASFPQWPAIMPPFLPVAGSLRAGPDGMLWIPRPLTAASTNTVYNVVDRRGELVARVTMDKETNVVAFGRNAVYTVLTDENGIQHLQRRPLPKL